MANRLAPVFVFEPDPECKDTIEKALKELGHTVLYAPKIGNARSMLTNQRFGLAVINVQQRGRDILKLLSQEHLISGDNMNYRVPTLGIGEDLRPSEIKEIGKMVKKLIMKPLSAEAIKEICSQLYPGPHPLK